MLRHDCRREPRFFGDTVCDWPDYAHVLADALYDIDTRIQEGFIMTQADIADAAAQIEANTSKLASIQGIVEALEAQVAANSNAPVSTLDLGPLKAAVSAQTDAVNADDAADEPAAVSDPAAPADPTAPVVDPGTPATPVDDGTTPAA